MERRGGKREEKKETERGMQKEKDEEEKEVEEVGGLSPFKVTGYSLPHRQGWHRVRHSFVL